MSLLEKSSHVIYLLVFYITLLWSSPTLYSQQKTHMPPNPAFIKHPTSQNVYPHYLKQLGDSLNGLEKQYKAYFTSIVHSQTPGFKKFQFANYREGKKIIPIQFYRFDKDYPYQTNEPLHIYISGKTAFLALQMIDGSTTYTQDGRMELQKDGSLTSLNLSIPVLGENGPIFLPHSDIVIKRNGEIYYNDEFIDKLKIVTFNSTDGLWGHENTLFFIIDKNKTTELENVNVHVIQGYVEGSNQYLALESSKIIQPYYEGAARATKSLVDSHKHMFRAVGPE